MDVNVNERKVHKVHIQDKKVKEQRADRCSLQSLENVYFSQFFYFRTWSTSRNREITLTDRSFVTKCNNFANCILKNIFYCIFLDKCIIK
jgi:hypothetical protein